MKNRVLASAGLITLLLLAEGVWVWAFRPDPAQATRNSAGTESIPNTFVSGTAISSSAVNANFADLGVEMTDSLNRSGKGGMLAALRGVDGTVAAPAFSWTSETGSGLYRIGASDVGFAISGTKVGEWTANGYRSANGAVATPSLSFFNDTGAGLYRIGSNDIGFAVNGALSTEWNATGFGVGVAPLWKLHVKLASSGATAIASTSAMIESNGTHFLNLLAPNANSSGIAFGDVSNPSRGFIEYKNTANASADQMQFGAAGATKMVIGSGGMTIGSSGTAISASLASTSGSLSPSAISANTCNNIYAPAVAGATNGAPCAAGTTDTTSGIVYFCQATAGGCNVYGCNVTTGSKTPAASTTYSCRVFNP